MLQEAVDALFDNGRPRPRSARNQQSPAQSLSDTLKASRPLPPELAVSVWTFRPVGDRGCPELKLNQCGLRRRWRSNFFKRSSITTRSAGSLPDHQASQGMVEQQERWCGHSRDVIREHPVLLNRAPDVAIAGHSGSEPAARGRQSHPHSPRWSAPHSTRTLTATKWLCTSAFSRIAGGKLRVDAQLAQHFVSGHGLPLAVPSQDMVLGIYY